jgi:hypothetical protein
MFLLSCSLLTYCAFRLNGDFLSCTVQGPTKRRLVMLHDTIGGNGVPTVSSVNVWFLRGFLKSR